MNPHPATMEYIRHPRPRLRGNGKPDSDTAILKTRIQNAGFIISVPAFYKTISKYLIFKIVYLIAGPALFL
jgi:hypothetical protein